MIAGVLIFSVLVAIASALIVKKRDTMDGTEIATYIVLIAWGSLVWGFFLAQ